MTYTRRWAILSGIVLTIILLIAYYCGGYVAGRLARFDGTKQGIAVWVWGMIIAVLVAILAAVAGSQFNILGSLGGARTLSSARPSATGTAGPVLFNTQNRAPSPWDKTIRRRPPPAVEQLLSAGTPM